MNFCKNKIFEYLKNKSISLLGFGKSNRAVASLLNELGLNFQVRDKHECYGMLENFKNSKIDSFFGENYLEDLNCDIIFRTPVIRPDIQEISEAVKYGSICSSEIDLFLKFCPTKNIFAVTGSDGKSTTTSLIYEILKSSGKDVFLGGNIGIPIISQIDNISNDSFVVLELSSFQLISCNINPKVSIITNISENHLDWHINFNEYVLSKSNIFNNQSENNTLVINFDDELSKKISSNCKASKRFFSLKHKLKNGSYLDSDGYLVHTKNQEVYKIIHKNDIKIPGIHNVSNFLSSICACLDYVSTDDIRYVAKNFPGLSHRIEFVRRINDVEYYDDSIASTPNRVINGSLSLFDKNIILIAGGYDKNLNYDEFANMVCRKVKILILIGQTTDKIESCVLKLKSDRIPKIFKASSMIEAVNFAYVNSSKNDKVLLSPACASFGMYNNFEERGNDFKLCVLSLEKLEGEFNDQKSVCKIVDR